VRPADRVEIVRTGNDAIRYELLNLEAGDALNFESTRPHRYENPGTETSVSLWVLTPPSF
jgi:hypothetical protein